MTGCSFCIAQDRETQPLYIDEHLLKPAQQYCQVSPRMSCRSLVGQISLVKIHFHDWLWQALLQARNLALPNLIVHSSYILPT